jgi:hypothetical protein
LPLHRREAAENIPVCVRYQSQSVECCLYVKALQKSAFRDGRPGSAELCRSGNAAKLAFSESAAPKSATETQLRISSFHSDMRNKCRQAYS